MRYLRNGRPLFRLDYSTYVSPTLFFWKVNHKYQQTRTTGIILITTFLHALVFFSGMALCEPSHSTQYIKFRCILSSCIFPNPWRICNKSRSGVRIANYNDHWFNLIWFRRMLPFSLGCSAISAFSGILVSRTGQYRPLMQVAFAIFALGMGLMIQLTSTSSMYVLAKLSCMLLIHDTGRRKCSIRSCVR